MQDSGREILPGNLKFTHYDLDLTPDLKNFNFKCTETIVFYVARDTNEIVLNGKELQIHKARVIYDGEIYAPCKVVYDTENCNFQVKYYINPKGRSTRNLL